MATDQTGWSVSYQADADLSAKQYFLVKRATTADRAALVAATTDIPIGILQNKPDAVGKAAEVMVLGRSKAQVEATTDIAIGDKLGPDANGRLIVKTANNAVVNAMAEAAATAATGDIITVTVFPPVWLGV